MQPIATIKIISGKISKQIVLIPFLLSITNSAQATLIQFDLSGAPMSLNWALPILPPDSLEVSFVLDTRNLASATYDFAGQANSSEPACLRSFRVNETIISDVSVQASNSSNLWHSNIVAANLGGDQAGQGCSGGFFAFLSFIDGNYSFDWAFDPSPNIRTVDFLASSDPLADLLLGFQTFPGSYNISGDWGRLYGSFTDVHLTQVTAVADPVPEPATVSLLGMGLLTFPFVKFKKSPKRNIR